MKLYGHPWSPNTRKALMTFAERGAAPDFVMLDLPAGAHKAPAHLERHPFGKVPVLEDGAFTLYESRAITAYVDDVLPGPRLRPEAAQAAALVEQWIAVADAYLAPHADLLIVETVFRRHLGGAPAPEGALAAAAAGIQAPLAAAEARLAKSTFLAGERLSRADLHWLPYLDLLLRGGGAAREAIETRRALAAWVHRVSARPAWRQIVEAGPQP